PMPLGEHVMIDYQSLTFSLKAHPISFLREQLAKRNFVMNGRLRDMTSNRTVQVAGLVLVRQRPGSAKGVIFETIEDETGVANIIVWPKTFEKYRNLVLGSRCIAVRGKLQNVDNVIHVVAHHVEDLTPLLSTLHDCDTAIESLANADEVRRPQEDIRQKIKPASRLARLLREAPELRADYVKLAARRQAQKVLPKGRNFH
ncbi:MAG: OB-fold nucleic acid binding domain-containing protein, partial [Pseudomonadota bacterium]